MLTGRRESVLADAAKALGANAAYVVTDVARDEDNRRMIAAVRNALAPSTYS
jgi:NADP-dependent 3-hydroxy acid dehydrogenase YdfG